jgi:hypothetical protein
MNSLSKAYGLPEVNSPNTMLSSSWDILFSHTPFQLPHMLL